MYTQGGKGIEHSTSREGASLRSNQSESLTPLPPSRRTTTTSPTMSNASPPMPPQSADLPTTWAFLEEGVDHIMTKLKTGVSYSKYMSLYTVAYNYCTSSKMHPSAGDHSAGAGNRSESSNRSTCILRCVPKRSCLSRHILSRRKPDGLGSV
jgi:hypothetical protein